MDRRKQLAQSAPKSPPFLLPFTCKKRTFKRKISPDTSHDTYDYSCTYNTQMSRKRSAAHNSLSDSSSRHGFQPTQHASEGAYSEGDWTGQYGGYKDQSYSDGLQTGQEQNTFVPSIHPSEGQWSQQQQQQQQQQPWQFFNTHAINAAFQPFSQPQLYAEPTSQQWSWSQQYPQYGHINPTFLPQQSVANTQYPTQQPANTINNGYGRSYTSSGAAHNGGQGAGNGYNYQTNQIPVANSQTYQQSANFYQPASFYNPSYYQNSFQQIQPQSQPFQYKGTGRSEAVPTPERYGNGFSQLQHNMGQQLTATTGENPRLYLIPEPKPSQEYLERANLPPRRLTSPKKLLIVLDLNGTLLVRSNRGSTYTPRPHVNEFLAYCLEHHKLIVWSSARPHNVKPMVAQLFNAEQHAKLVEVWHREHLRLGVHYNEKVQVYKQLSWLWEDVKVQASFPVDTSAPFKIEDGWKEPSPTPTKWDQSNTVLLDDTTDKAASEPYNLICVDEFTKEKKDDGDDVLGRVMAYLEDLKWEADVSAAMRVRPFVNGEAAGQDEELERPPSA